jgi:hypothetical protein
MKMKKIYLSAFIVVAVSISLVSYAAGSFSDVNSAHPYSEAINSIASKGIVEGYGDGSYGPYNTLSRSELLKIVVESVYENEFESFSGESCFDDVPSGEWYTKYICFAKSKGIVAGYGDGSFKPNAKISFVEALKIAEETFSFEIVEMDPWYKGYVDLAGEKNFVPLSVKDFHEEFSRGQMAELITRILKYNEGSLDNYLGEKSDNIVTYEKLVNAVQNRVVLDGLDQCFLNENCSENEFCIKDTCVGKSKVLPDNEISSLQNCAYDEVYVDEVCEKAKMSIAFVNTDGNVDDVDAYIDESMGAFISLTGMSACPEKVKIIRKHNFCLPKEEGSDDISKALFDDIGGEMHFFMLYEDALKESQCSTFPGESELSGTAGIGSNSALVHELGHTVNLWDQYCYFPSDNNPNIVNFDEAACVKAEDEWYIDYCGREDLGSSTENAYQCSGDFNESGGRSIMGHGDSAISHFQIGFTEKELEYLAEELNCY